jgi:hypothetical protein
MVSDINCASLKYIKNSTMDILLFLFLFLVVLDTSEVSFIDE